MSKQRKLSNKNMHRRRRGAAALTTHAHTHATSHTRTGTRTHMQATPIHTIKSTNVQRQKTLEALATTEKQEKYTTHKINRNHICSSFVYWILRKTTTSRQFKCRSRVWIVCAPPPIPISFRVIFVYRACGCPISQFRVVRQTSDLYTTVITQDKEELDI